jgi:hypothetical protein
MVQNLPTKELVKLENGVLWVRNFESDEFYQPTQEDLFKLIRGMHTESNVFYTSFKRIHDLFVKSESRCERLERELGLLKQQNKT